MAEKFGLTIQLALQAPKNAPQIIQQINRQLSGVKVAVNVEGAKRTEKELSSVNRAATKVSRSVDGMSRSFAIATRRFAAFSVATRAVSLLTNRLSSAIDEAIKFQREMNKVSQVTGKTSSELKFLEQAITSLSTSLGTSSGELTNVARILSQAGFAASDLKAALSTLAKTTLAPTFDDITSSAEGAVAIFNQFGKGAAALEGQFGAINAVAGKFAVESGDLIGAVRRVGGVFKSAGGNLNDLIALFTSVRSTTRESAESIATGIRTIFTRIQRPKTIEFLRKFGVELEDLSGKFVGPFEATRRLSAAFGDLPEGDVKLIRVGEELAGFRQIGKVIPLLQQFAVAEKARAVALAGTGSLDADAAKAQATLAVQIQKVKEEYLALIRSFADTSTFKSLVKITLGLASSFAQILESLKPLLPLIATFAAVKIGSGVAALVGSRLTRRATGGPVGLARGGVVPGSGSGDTVPAMLTPGEFVIKKSSVGKIGTGALSAMNNNRFASGGLVIKNTDNTKYAGLFAKPRNIEDSTSNKPLSLPGDTLRATSDKPGREVLAVTGNPPSYYIGRKDEADFETQAEAALEQSINSLVENISSGKTSRKATPQILKNVGSKDIAGKIFEGVTKTVIGGRFTGKSNESGFDLKANDLTSEVLHELQGLFGADLRRIDYDNKLSENRGSRSSLVKKASNKKHFNDNSDIQLVSYSNQLSTDDILKLKNGPDKNTKAQKRLSEINVARGKLSSTIEDNDIVKIIDSRLRNQSRKLAKFSDRIKTTKVKKAASGGGISGSDTVPALLTPGEFVINKSAASKIGTGNLHKMNKGGVPGFAKGGFVGVQRFQDGGGVLGGGSGAADFATRLAIIGPVVTSVISSFGDTSEKASDQLFKISTIGQKVATTLTLIGGTVIFFRKTREVIKGFEQSITKSAERFGNTIKKSEDNVALRRREADAVTKSAAQSKGIEDSLKPKVVTDRQIKADLEKSNVKLQKREFLGQQKVDDLKSVRAATGDITLTSKIQQAEANLLKVRKRQETASKKLSTVSDRLSKNQLRLTGASNSLKKSHAALERATERITVAEKRLANLRRKSARNAVAGGFKRLGGAAASVATGALAVGAIVQQIGTAISSSISEFAGREVARLEKKGDVSGVAKAAEIQGLADLVSQQLSFGGILQSFFDSNTIEKGLQRVADNRVERVSNTAAANISGGLTDFADTDRGSKALDALIASAGKDVSDARASFDGDGAFGRDVSPEQKRASLLALRKSLAPTAELIGTASKSAAEMEARIKEIAGSATELIEPLSKLAVAARNAAAAQEARGKLELDSLRISSSVKRAETARDNKIAGFETGSSPLEANLKTLQTSLSTLGSSVAGERAISGLRTQLQSSGINVSSGSLVGRQIDNASSANAFQSKFDDLVNNTDFLEGDRKNDFLRELTILAENSTNDVVNTSVLDAIGGLRESNTGGRLQADELSKIGGVILEATQSVIKPLAELSQAEIDHLKVINDLTKRRRSAELEYIASQEKAIETQIEASQIIAKFGGGSFSSQNELGERVSQFNVRARDAGVSGLTSGTAEDIGRVGSGIARRFQELQTSVTRRGLAGTGGLSIDEDKRKELQATNQSLITLTRQRIDLLKKEVDIVKQKNALEKSSIESLLSGDIEGFFNQQGAAGAASALRSGDTSALRAFSATDIAGGLKSISEQLDQNGGNRQEFERISANVLGGFGLSGRSAQVFAETTPEIENFNRQIRASAEQLGRQAGIAAELQSMTVSTSQVIIDATNVEFRNGQVRGGVGQPVPLQNQMVSQLNEFTDKAAAIAGALKNSSVKFSIPEGVKVFLEGADFLNISKNLTPFVNDLIGAYMKNLRLDPGGQPKQNFGLVPK